MDMQKERDILVKRVFPQLRKRCEERAVSWIEVDLRWGITDEQTTEGKVLPLCLEEIRRSRYFIGLLGERYGTITDEEISHGVFAAERTHDHAYCYFRDPGHATRFAPESPENREKLRSLKEKIRAANAANLCRLREGYANPEELGEWILEDWAQLIDRIFPIEDVPDALPAGDRAA